MAISRQQFAARNKRIILLCFVILFVIRRYYIYGKQYLLVKSAKSWNSDTFSTSGIEPFLFFQIPIHLFHIHTSIFYLDKPINSTQPLSVGGSVPNKKLPVEEVTASQLYTNQNSYDTWVVLLFVIVLIHFSPTVASS